MTSTSGGRVGLVGRALAIVTRAESGGVVYSVAVVIAYVLVPLLVYAAGLENEYFLELARLAVVGALFVLLGTRVPLFDTVIERDERKITWDLDSFVAIVWGTFLVFIAVAFVTAERIPLIAALQGADKATVATLREQFLKAREGWQASLVYVNAGLAGALVPYSLALMLLYRHRHRWLLFCVFLAYCVSFVEKSFFLRAAIPLLYLTVHGRMRSPVRPRTILVAGAALLFAVTVASGIGSEDASGGEEYFSADYAPNSPLAALGWRALAIPVVTAADALRVIENEYGGRALMGATSSFVAGVTGMERVAFERDVYGAQWGQNETETGSANSVFLTEAFANFRWPGVIAFSVFAGLLFRVFSRTHDEALRALWMIFAYALYAAPLVGTLLSNGYALLIVLSTVFRFVPTCGATLAANLNGHSHSETRHSAPPPTR